MTRTLVEVNDRTLDLREVNLRGGSLAIGYPWGATGVRVVASLAAQMRERDARLGLLSVCSAGGMGGAMVLEV